MQDEKLFELAVNITVAKIRTHFTSPSVMGHDDWIADQISKQWNQLRNLWRDGHQEGNVQHIE